MKRSKVVIGIFVALLLIALTIVLLACTVFVVRDITVVKAVVSPLLDEERIVESSDISKGQSIISLDKEKTAANIEKAIPYAEVTSITREFPSKVVINVTIRTGTMAVSSEDEHSLAIIDSKLKVLNVISVTEQTVGLTVIKGAKFRIPDEGAVSLIGSFAEFTNDSCKAMLSEIADAAAKLAIEGKSFSTFFKEISFVTGEGIKAYVRTNKGVALVLDSTRTASVYTQLFECMNVFVFDKSSDLTKGFITLTSNLEGIGYMWTETE